VPSLKFWDTSDMKVWLGNLTTQNLPDKSQIFQLLEKQESTYVYTYLYCDRGQTVFWNILFKFIRRYILLENVKPYGFDRRLIANLQLHIHEHMFNRRRFMTTHILSMCTYYTFLKPCYFTCKQTEVLCSKL